MKKRFSAFLIACLILAVSVFSPVASVAAVSEASSVPANTFLSFYGFQVRDKEYNGLRSIFKIDRTAMKALEDTGCKVVEYGVLAASSQKLRDVGDVLEVFEGDDGYETLNYASKVTIYKNGKIVGNVNEITETEITFTLAITNYTLKNFDKNAHVRGYTVIEDANGIRFVFYADYPTVKYRHTSLMTICEYLAAQGLVTKESCISYADVIRFNEIVDADGWGDIVAP